MRSPGICHQMVPSIIAFTTCYQLLRQLLHTFLSVAVLFSKIYSSADQRGCFQRPHLWFRMKSHFFLSELQFRMAATTTHSYICIRTQNAGLIPQRVCTKWTYCMCEDMGGGSCGTGKVLTQAGGIYFGGSRALQKKKEDKWHKLKNRPVCTYTSNAVKW